MIYNPKFAERLKECSGVCQAQQRGQGALSQAGSGGPGRPPTPKPQSAAGAAGPSETRTAKRKADVPPADAPKKVSSATCQSRFLLGYTSAASMLPTACTGLTFAT